MRFFANGPAIPDALLSDRSKGEVVFFCGAGVSMPAGQPSFFKLTELTMDKVHVAPSSQIGRLTRKARAKNNPALTLPLDQVFGLLQKEYGADKIEKEVAALLKIKNKPLTTNHETILQLSSDVEGNPFVVTTNFDLLFEHARKGLRAWVPPQLPDMVRTKDIKGVVYLHGRLPSSSHIEPSERSLVLSSSDFGRAYLADGWATRFIRELLDERTVVLLGYSAGDPPVRYLLEGLNASGNARRRSIYAFDRGDSGEVQAKWADLGVTGIAFPEFPDLWQSLEAWAMRTRTPENLRAGFMNLASNSPRTLQPFERGQVVSFVRSIEGAKAFYEADPPPPAEWLCVFDSNARFAPPERRWHANPPTEIDSLAIYGLDNDPPRKPPLDRTPYDVGLDLLQSQTSDDQSHPSRLSNWPNDQTLSYRLRLLSGWFEKVAHEPAAIWWAARQSYLHPFLRDAVSRRLTHAHRPFEPKIRTLWTIILECVASQRHDDYDPRWFEFEALKAADGWSPVVLRTLEEILKPWLEMGTPSYSKLFAILDGADDGEPVGLEHLTYFNLRGSVTHETTPVPDDHVSDVFAILRRGFDYATRLLSTHGIDKATLTLPAISPDTNRRGEVNIDPHSLAQDFLWAVDLFRRLATIAPKTARVELLTWPHAESEIFDKLRIFAWTLPDLIDPGDVVAGLEGLSRETFWHFHLGREILHLLRSRWSNFGSDERQRVEAVILKGPENTGDTPPQEHPYVGLRLAWLDSQGCALSDHALIILAEFRASPNWHEDWVASADDDHQGRGGSVTRVIDPGILPLATLSEMDALLEKLSDRKFGDFIDPRPFTGLVEQYPRKALLYLRRKARTNVFPADLWKQLLEHWPTTSPRIAWLCGQSVVRVSSEILSDASYLAANWMKRNLPLIETYRSTDYWRLWDALFDRFQHIDAEATRGPSQDHQIGWEVIRPSRRTLQAAEFGPIGELVRALLNRFAENPPEGAQPLPVEIKIRFERALASVGDGADHAAVLLGQNASFLLYNDPDWTKEYIIPLFKNQHPRAEAAWNGFLSGNSSLPPSLFKLLKKPFLKMFRKHHEWFKDAQFETRAAHLVVLLTFWGLKNDAYLSADDCRETLRHLSDRGRDAALFQVRQVLKDRKAWETYGKPFFSTMWPQELRYQTRSVTNILMMIAEDHVDLFPKIIAHVSDFLRPMPMGGLYTLTRKRGSDETKRSLAERFPETVLDLIDRLLPPDYAGSQLDLKSVLTTIAEAAPELRSGRVWRRLNRLVNS